jgi:hypothetical protein
MDTARDPKLYNPPHYGKNVYENKIVSLYKLSNGGIRQKAVLFSIAST